MRVKMPQRIIKFDLSLFGNLVARKVDRVSNLPVVLLLGREDERLQERGCFFGSNIFILGT